MRQMKLLNKMHEVTRRDFGLGGVAASVVAGWPIRLLAAEERPALPIPPELRANASGVIELNIQTGQMQALPSITTPTYGVNGPYLAPAVRVGRGEKVLMKVTNSLPEPTTMHWHGLMIPGEVDGGPYSVITPGETWVAPLSIEQAAATCWFHPHFYPTTAAQVIKGVAGLFLIEDEESDALGLPSRWGIDDIPLVLQDRRFNSDGTFFHRMNLTAITAGFIGDTMLVNGAFYPQARTARGWLRFRLLNGSNARSYRLAVSDGRPMYVVASDGGLLAEPVEMQELTLVSGERYEVLVDARDGNVFDLVTRPTKQMGMTLPPFDTELSLVTLLPDGADGQGALPDTLVSIPPLIANLPPASQNLVMGMNLDDAGMRPLKKAGLMKMEMSGNTDPEVVSEVTKLITKQPVLPLTEQFVANTIDDKPFEMGTVPFGVQMRTDLRWTISEGGDKMMHPVHIHGCQFRILALDGKPSPAHMAGWKDIVPISRGGSAEIQIRFDHPASKDAPFMAHCHILEHEDSGMMTKFTVE